MKKITLNRDDYHFGGTFGEILYTILVRKTFTNMGEDIYYMDKDNKIPNVIFKRCDGRWGYADNKGDEFRVIFV